MIRIFETGDVIMIIGARGESEKHNGRKAEILQHKGEWEDAHHYKIRWLSGILGQSACNLTGWKDTGDMFLIENI